MLNSAFQSYSILSFPIFAVSQYLTNEEVISISIYSALFSIQ